MLLGRRWPVAEEFDDLGPFVVPDKGIPAVRVSDRQPFARPWTRGTPIKSATRALKGRRMAKAMIETLVDDLDGSPATETIQLGWNGDWREVDLSKRNIAALTRALDRYWAVGRPVPRGGQTGRRRNAAPSRSRKAARSKKSGRDPKAIRAWALANSIEVPSRGRIPGEVERQYNEALAT
jgi:hypothetical protein